MADWTGLSPRQVIDALAGLGVQLWLDGGALRFRARKGAVTGEIRTMLAARRAELEGVLGDPERGALPLIAPAPAHRHEPFALTEIQQAYWIGRQAGLELGGVGCHVYYEVDARGIDVARLIAAWRSVVERHDMLRAVVGDDGLQRVLPWPVAVDVPVIDLSREPADRVAAALAALRAALSHRVLPADRPLHEVRIAVLPDDRARVVFSIDMLVVDAASVFLLLDEWGRIYRGAAPLPPPAIGFRDYVVAWPRVEATGAYAAARAYWRDRLPSLPAGPALPGPTSPARARLDRFTHRAHRLAPERWRGLVGRARERGMTSAGVLAACYAEVLATWSSEPRFCLNLPLFSRLPLHPAIGDVLGDFSSTLLLEVDATPATLEARFAHLQRRLYADLEHRLFGGVSVLRELNRTRDRGAAPAMPVVFTAARLDSGAAPSWWAWLGEVVYGVSQTPHVHLDCQVHEDTGALVTHWDSVDARFPPGLVDTMFEAYGRLLDQLAVSDEAWRAPLGALTPANQLAVRAAVNATAAPVPPGLLHDGFLRRATRAPERIAVAGARRLSYGELEQRSRALAAALAAGGVAANDLVAVCIAKGWEQVVAVLGVSRAGAAYVPIDPALPAERIARLIGDAGARHVVVAPRTPGTWPEPLVVHVVDDAPPPRVVAPACPARPGDLAYVIYTSGSTGAPKGVAIQHRAALNTIVDITARFGVTDRDCVLSLSSLSFDLSVYDVFGLLAAGGTVVVPGPDAARDPARWVELMRTEQVTVWNTVPALMEMLVEHLSVAPNPTSSLAVVLLSGDWIPLALPERVSRLFPTAKLVSLGGATEAAIWSIYHPIDRIEPGWTSVPYGVPLANQAFHVLSDALEPVPDWVPGQLFIGGIGLAREYWRDADKTAAAFVVHPRTAERLYRTGDLGRYRPGGVIEFLGRRDAQIKLNGFRIELGEIEAAVRGHPAVEDCHVLARYRTEAAAGDLAPGTRRPAFLVAYVVVRPGTEVDGSALKAFLATKLPAYMVPSHVVAIDAIPRSANGKIDRRGFPDPQVRASERTPQSPATHAVAALWAQVLGVDYARIDPRSERAGGGDPDGIAGGAGALPRGIDPDTGFFELGGNSLQLLRLANLIERRLGVRVPLAELFQDSTTAGQAQAIERARGHGGDAALAIEPDPASAHEPFPLLDIQQAYWLGSRMQTELGGVGCRYYQELESGELDVERLIAAFHQLIERHPMLRAEVLGDGTQRVLAAPPPWQPVRLDLRGASSAGTGADADAGAQLAAMRDHAAHRTAPSGTWPMFDLAIAELPGGRCRIGWAMDMIVCDAASLFLLAREWRELYRGHALPLITLGFRDYVVARPRLEHGAAFARARAYWAGRLATLPPRPDLPLATATHALAGQRFRRHAHVVPPLVWAPLRTRASARGLTPAALALAAYADAIAAFSGFPRFTLNLPILSRPALHPEIDAVVGDFSSTVLLEVDATPRPFAERAAQLQAQLWRDLAHAAYGGVAVQRDLARQHGPASANGMPVVFTMAGDGDAAAAFDWLGDPVFGLSQTPQVWIDAQAHERRGGLALHWDIVESIFPAGMPAAMFATQVRLLHALATDEQAWDAPVGAFAR